MSVAEGDNEYDLVIVGSGGGGLVAALAAAEAGLRPIILEKQSVVGGSTAMSGGIIWMPNNPLMVEEGISDSVEDGTTYLQSVIGDPDDASSVARRSAFLEKGPEMMTFIRNLGVELVRCDGYADYYDTHPGGNARGRSVEASPWNGKQLGDWYSRINPGIGPGIGLVIKTNEVRNVAMVFRSVRTFLATARVVMRTYLSRALGKDLFTNGMSLVGQMTKILVDRGVPIRLDTAVEELIVEEGRVVGVRVRHKGETTEVRGSRGVLLAAGGFEHNTEFRSKVTAETQPNDGRWSIGNPGNTGEVLQAAIAVGAHTEYMDEAVWFLVPRPEMAGSTLGLARQLPHTIMVNQDGKRFVNESNSYIEVGRAMYANNGAPCWLIFDEQYRRAMPWTNGMPKLRHLWSTRPGNIPKEWLEQDWILQADTIDELAAKMGVDPRALTETVSTFNVSAVRGEDPQFHRGESQYNRALGDPGRKANPAVGPIAKGPYYATQIFPGDVGTIGGVLCNEQAQVLDDSYSPIPGLYATGNMAASMTGRAYPGAGASIAYTMAFGYIAANHVAAADHTVSATERPTPILRAN
ncbi:FAD-binding protein [Rhodococcus fascians]|nr:FAD-binding protein [Rhodococcus fascians]MBY4140950.1 FAD-binding protein [Rhodococcus fascians]MBY4219614.1 FAD-binding protein [Rhodococcus fascians]MBY4221923.1 FAD-binding protein [Rhodococcus fascians]MBY4233924.1 FAD-binding protein [Rhodococcus fascians]